MIVAILIGIAIESNAASDQSLSLDQRLIVACYELDVDAVVTAIREGADVNGRFGDADRMIFKDPWTHGYPMAAAEWTPLIAVASASKYPRPPREVQNSVSNRKWAYDEMRRIPADQLEQRQDARLTIAAILLSHKADINAHDGHGATALYESIYARNLDMAKLLLRFDADVNTKTGVYIDGPGDTTPLHRAYWSEELMQLLLERGADPTAKDTWGQTPADWAAGGNSSELFRPNRASDRPTTERP
jgi:hypothetical protein